MAFLDSSIFQSNGLCHDFCHSSYAFAVVQGNGCWCSNYVPVSTTSSSGCNKQYPGYPQDLCGGDGLYGYIALSKLPSGTAGGSATVSLSAAPVSSSVQPSRSTTFVFWFEYSHCGHYSSIAMASYMIVLPVAAFSLLCNDRQSGGDSIAMTIFHALTNTMSHRHRVL